MRKIPSSSIVVAICLIIVAACMGFKSSFITDTPGMAYIRGIGVGTEPWKAVPYTKVDFSFSGNMVTVRTTTGVEYLTSIENVVFQKMNNE